MKLIVITDETSHPYEMETLTELLSRSASVHIRKPKMTDPELTLYLQQIPDPYRKQVSLHGNRAVAEKFGLGGLHLKSDQTTDKSWRGRLSKSFHSVEHLVNDLHQLDYAFLSPVFDSISKKGYRAAFDPERLKTELRSIKNGAEVFALGGITAERLDAVERMGFAGVAVVGTIWQHPDIRSRVGEFEKLMSYAG